MGGITSVANRIAPYVAIGALVIFGGMMLFGLTLAAGFASISGGGGAPESADSGVVSCDGQPLTGKKYKGGDFKEFVPLYQGAAKKYKLGPQGPNILASIHEIETGFRGSEHGAESSVGAQGPMQFMPPTWAAYGVDANKNGQKDVNDPEDAIYGAARYLSANKAPSDWHSAILRYNNAEWYYQDVWKGKDKFKIEACA